MTRHEPVPPAPPDSPAGDKPPGAASAIAGRRSSFFGDLRVVWAEHDFRRLLSTRVLSQTGDGVLTSGLGTYVFFNATTFPNPARGAAALAVLYLPYSLIGPFAGVFIDRWSRRQILVWSALIRSVFVVPTAALMAAGNQGVPLYVAVLLVLGVNRFFLSALSAALPHVVAGDKLVMGNAVSPTVGGVMAAIGGIIGLGVNAATGDTERGAAITVLVAGVCYVTASLVARTMGRSLLGPTREPGERPPRQILTELRVVAVGLADGVRYVASRRRPAAALGAVGGKQLFYGILVMMSVLLYRNYYYRGVRASTAEAHYGYLVAAAAVGFFCAALVTPQVTRRLTKPAVITVLLAASAVVIGGLGGTFSQPAYLVMGFCVGLAGQGVAICAITVLQEELPDDYRGRAFSLYDMMFNITFAAGALISVPFMPLSGKSEVVIAVVAVGYAVVAAGYWALSRGTTAS